VQVCGAPGADAAAQILDLARLESRLTPLGPVVRSGVMLRFDPAELPGTRLTIFADGRAIVRGTSDPARARSLYARFVGA
jgi:adenylyltransferase/sulfurtransferase